MDNEFDPITEELELPTRVCRHCSVLSATEDDHCPDCGKPYARRGFGSKAAWTRVLVAMAITVPIAFGAFFLGQQSRMSDQEVSKRIADRAVRDKRAYQKRTQTALLQQEGKLRRVFNKRAKSRAEKAYKTGQSVGFSSGRSVGYSTGHDEGAQEGFSVGLDLGACLTDYTYC